MSKNRSKLKQELVEALRRHSGLTVLFHSAIADRMGLGPADHKCLDLLMRLGPLSAGELADRSGLTTGAITGVIDRLERSKYVARASDANDRRRVVVEPQLKKANADFGPIFAGIAKDTAALLDEYTADQLELLLEFVNSIDTLVEAHTAGMREN